MEGRRLNERGYFNAFSPPKSVRSETSFRINRVWGGVGGQKSKSEAPV